MFGFSRVLRGLLRGGRPADRSGFREGGSGRPPSPRKSPLPSLRPPTLMIDLLFGALMLFAFQMGDPRGVIPRDIQLPTSDAGGKPEAVLPVRPVKNAGAWAYELSDGGRRTADEIVAMSREDKRTPILLIPRTSTVETYIEAEAPLRERGLRVGLAVELEGGHKP